MYFILILFMLAIGFGLAALLTWLISLTGLIVFTWKTALVVWGIIILLRIIFG